MLNLTPVTMGMPRTKASTQTQPLNAIFLRRVLSWSGNWSRIAVMTVSAAEN